MRFRYIWIASLMTLREVFRRRIVILLLVVIPALFYAVTCLTTNMIPFPFKLAAVKGEPGLIVPARHIGLVFMGLASTGLLAAFLSMSLIQRNIRATRRLILCGFSTSEISLSKMLVMLSITILLGFYVGSMLCLFFQPHRYLTVIAGFILIGFVYGSYGLLIGTLLRGELEGILLITLLANIDIGWLQNPIFYAGALNKALIRGLPAFYPSQLSNISAFSDHNFSRALMGSIFYGGILLALALLVFWLRMRKK
ncbi:MAG: hypothetical protein ABFS28_05140 [Bacteroidota bacterium]